MTSFYTQVAFNTSAFRSDDYKTISAYEFEQGRNAILEALKTEGLDPMRTHVITSGFLWMDQCATSLFNDGLIGYLTIHTIARPNPWGTDFMEGKDTQGINRLKLQYKYFHSHSGINLLTALAKAVSKGAVITEHSTFWDVYNVLATIPCLFQRTSKNGFQGRHGAFGYVRKRRPINSTTLFHVRTRVRPLSLKCASSPVTSVISTASSSSSSSSSSASLSIQPLNSGINSPVVQSVTPSLVASSPHSPVSASTPSSPWASPLVRLDEVSDSSLPLPPPPTTTESRLKYRYNPLGAYTTVSIPPGGHVRLDSTGHKSFVFTRVFGCIGSDARHAIAEDDAIHICSYYANRDGVFEVTLPFPSVLYYDIIDHGMGVITVYTMKVDQKEMRPFNLFTGRFM